MREDVATGAGSDADYVEVGRAIDSGEASIWVRQLEEQGVPARMEKRGGLLRTILYFGRRPVSVLVPSRDHITALAYLKRLRFIR